MEHISVSVFRDAWLTSDCTKNGVSARHNRLELFWDCTRNEAQHYCSAHKIAFDTALFLVKRDLWGEDHSYAEPLFKPNGKLEMFGGNFVYTSDSRLYKLCGLKTAMPIPVHDRFETQEEYEAMTV